jgi:hypothetical protein
MEEVLKMGILITSSLEGRVVAAEAVQLLRGIRKD